MLTLADLFDRNARYFPQREAFVCDGERLTHARYAERSRRLASALHGLGLRRQDRFAILAMNCLEFYEAYAAAEYGATILVPVNFRLAPAEIVHVLKDAGARGLIFEERYAATVAQIRSQVPGVEFFVQVGGQPDAALEYEALLAQADPEGPPLRPQPEDLSVLWYTSGTT